MHRNHTYICTNILNYSIIFYHWLKVINYESFIKDKGIKGLETLYSEVHTWVEEPYKLFRHYTVYYFKKIFENIKKQLMFQLQYTKI